MANEYPLPKFHFQVEWGGTKIAFTEVTGLEVTQEVIEYRDGAMPEMTFIKQAGLRKYSNITLKRGMFKGDLEQGELEIGQVSVLIDEIMSVSEIVDSILREFNSCKTRLAAINIDSKS